MLEARAAQQAQEQKKKEKEQKSVYSLSGVVTEDDFQPTEAYKKLIATERPKAIFFTVAFILFTPLVFRYLMYASGSPGDNYESKVYQTGNATLKAKTDWTCKACDYVEGVTLNKLTVKAWNITNPNTEGGFPSVAVFASQDLKTWYNFYSTMDIGGQKGQVQNAFIDNYEYSKIRIANSTETACLGNVYNNYLVVCLNIMNIANTFALGEEVRGPPFNDRCFQAEGLCGIPCADLSNGQEPPMCKDGKMPQELFIDNNITETVRSEGQKPWGAQMTFMDWVLVITIFLDTIGNIMRFLPCLSGTPTEMEAGKSVKCSGTAVLSNTTPIVAENEAIFLRGLVGRTLTVLHTVGGRHEMKGLYIDNILNEKRGEGPDRRLQMWGAWIQFIESIGKLKTRQMQWEINIYDEKPGKLDQDVHGAVIRTIHYKKGSQAHFNSSTSRIMFQGLVKEESAEATAKAEQGRRNEISLLAGPKKPVRRVGTGSLDLQDDDDSSDEEAGLLDPKPIKNKAASFDAIFDQKQQKKKIDFIDVTADSSMYVDMENLLPLVCFLNGWLEEIKSHDAIYNYKNKTEALRGIFNDAPYKKYFDDESLVEVQNRLLQLYSIFNGDKFQTLAEDQFFARPELSPHKFLRYDDYYETMWTITRVGLPDWQVTWSYFSRARLINKQKPEEVDTDVLRLDGTRVRKGSVVFLKVPDDVAPQHQMDKWFSTRERLYRVVENNPRNANGMTVKLEEWPLPEGGSNEEDPYEPEVIVRPIESVALIERNKGKAGALNVYLDFLRRRANKWAALNNVPLPIQTFAGIVDARHMMALPEVFWNEGLPHFARNEARLEDGTKVRMPTILVQYPQFFSNITRDDFLDNKNSGYYTIWQTLRDCAKVCTSSGTNAIWDVTDINFDYSVTSRIEDTATTHQILLKNLTVHCPSFVAYGIAKDTEDYIEAVYRWSTGAVELFWATLFSNQFSDFCIVLFYVMAYSIASFVDWVFAYYMWVAIVIAHGINAHFEQKKGLLPLRSMNVSCVVVMNCMYWISNLTSIVWVVVLPFQIAIMSEAPLAGSQAMAITWAFIALVLRAPTGIITDRLINEAKFLLPKTVKDQWNYNMVLWRSSQLFVCSFAYTALSVISGTRTAFLARFFDGDNTSWTSFRISDTAITQAWKDCEKISSFNGAYLIALGHYLSLRWQRFQNSFTQPDALTTWLAAFLYLFQIACIMISMSITNQEDAGFILTTIIVAGLNIFLVSDIAMLLFPLLGEVLGRPIRLEYLFGVLSAVVIVSLLIKDSLKDADYFAQVGGGSG